jgi:hypothetical protein
VDCVVAHLAPKEGGRMADAGLVELARKFVALSDQLDEVRDQIKHAVVNGSGGKPEAPFTSPARQGGNNQKAAAEEAKIIDLLRSSPNLKTAQIAKATASKTSTLSERLRRLKVRGEVTGGGNAGWTTPG